MCYVENVGVLVSSYCILQISVIDPVKPNVLSTSASFIMVCSNTEQDSVFMVKEQAENYCVVEVSETTFSKQCLNLCEERQAEGSAETVDSPV